MFPPTKAKKADEAFGAPGSTAVLGALRAIPTALGAAVLPNGRWRSAHDVFKHQIYLDAKFLGVAVKKKVYGMFAHFFSPRGRDAYGSLNRQRSGDRPSYLTSSQATTRMIL